MAQEKVKIGFITDMSSLYADVEGKNGPLPYRWRLTTLAARYWASPSSC
jgi:branched-chain amino acid transport system substrate-binding protein